MKKELGIFILLITLCVVVSFLNPQFLSAYNLQNNARAIGINGIFGIACGVVIITGGIDLSIGSVFALEGVLFASLLRGEPLMLWSSQHPVMINLPVTPWPIAVPMVIVAVLVLGLVHAFLIVKVRLQPFIVTLCGLLFYRSLARSLANDATKGFGAANLGAGHLNLKVYTIMNLDVFGLSIPMPFIIMCVVAAIMWIVIHRSIYGRYLFAVGRNEDAARYSGINSKLVIGSAYVLCMLLTAISGIILALDTGSIGPSDFGQTYELYGIAAAVLGGCSLRGGEGSIIGIIIGTALLRVLQNIVNLLGIPSSWNGGVIAVVILLGVTVDELLSNRRGQKSLISRLLFRSKSTESPALVVQQRQA
jgi:ribose transport system permease protein